ncbi:MAG TPA: hypothetical protein DCS75_06340 [Gemmatimonadetes bacterium]|nr:hypothetical protein [Gemmatimonadota bacterium]HCO13255.1 hypothetical protein [Gemmatimonadota bacterium]
MVGVLMGYRQIESMKTPYTTLHIIALLSAISVTAPVSISAQDSETDIIDPVPGESLKVWLLTAGPGDAVWERYGHNALRVLDTSTGRDISYNWGIFSFGEPVQFIVRFLQGRMVYMMAPFDTEAMLAAYEKDNREVVLQELDLTPSEKITLQNFAENNALPENRDYYYQYFRDNCSTRVRDALDMVLKGELNKAFGKTPTGTSYRWHTKRLTQANPLVYTGMDALLGPATDRELTIWDELFLPLSLRDQVRDLRIPRADGTAKYLVLAEERAVVSTRPEEPTAPPNWLLRFLSAGIIFGAIFSSLRSNFVQKSAVLNFLITGAATVWSGLLGVLGLIIVALLFTDHTFSAWNENLFLANPITFGISISLFSSSLNPSWKNRARKLSATCATIAVIGFIWQTGPISGHENGMFFAFLLPAHLGLAWGLR